MFRNFRHVGADVDLRDVENLIEALSIRLTENPRVVRYGGGGYSVTSDRGPVAVGMQKEDADFLVAAPNLIRALAAEVDAARSARRFAAADRSEGFHLHREIRYILETLERAKEAKLHTQEGKSRVEEAIKIARENAR